MTLVRVEPHAYTSSEELRRQGGRLNSTALCTQCLQEEESKNKKGFLFNRKQNKTKQKTSSTLLVDAVGPLEMTALTKTSGLISRNSGLLPSQQVILTPTHTCSLCPNPWGKDFNNQLPNPVTGLNEPSENILGSYFTSGSTLEAAFSVFSVLQASQ